MCLTGDIQLIQDLVQQWPRWNMDQTHTPHEKSTQSSLVSYVVPVCEHFNPWHAVTELFWSFIIVNIMVADALAPCIARTSVPMILCRIVKFLSCTRKDFNYLCHVKVERNDRNCRYILMFPIKNLARKGLMKNNNMRKNCHIRIQWVVESNLNYLLTYLSNRINVYWSLLIIFHIASWFPGAPFTNMV